HVGGERRDAAGEHIVESDRLHTDVAAGAAGLDARVVAVVAVVLCDLEILSAARPARAVVRPRPPPAPSRLDGRRRRTARTGAAPEGVATGGERVARVLARLIATLEGDDLGLVDALVALEAREAPAALDRRGERRAARTDRRVDAGRLAADLPA